MIKRYAISGNPVLHSQSPRIFNRLFADWGVDGHYTRMAVSSADQAVSLFKHLGLSGMNVTAPFKEEMIPLMDEVDEAVRSIGAVNTVVAAGDRLKGCNTDYLGVHGALKAHGTSISGQPCVVLGAGGAARAAVYALKEGGGRVTVVNRTFVRAKKLARSMGCHAAPIEDLGKVVESSKVIVSTISPGVEVLDASILTADQVVFDANYVGSPLAGSARDSTYQFIDGFQWLIHQAVGVVEQFTGTVVTADQMKPYFNRESEFDCDTNPLIVAGFPLAGIVARRLALIMDCPYVELNKHTAVFSDPSAGKGGKQVFYLYGNQLKTDLEKYKKYVPPVIVIAPLDICMSTAAFQSVDLVIDPADGDETMARRIYDEYQHIQ